MSRPVVAAVAAVVVALAVASVDFAITSSKVPDVPAPCGTTADAFCQEDRSDAFEERIDEAIALERGLEGRAWLYAALAALGVLAAAARGADKRSLGTAAVALAVLVSTLLLVGSGGLVSPPVPQAYLPCVVMGALALLGGGRPSIAEARGRVPALAAVGLTGLTVLLVVIFAGPQPDCGTAAEMTETAPGWTDAVAVLALVSALGAGGFALVALAQRRWLAAGLAIFVNPFALLAMAGSTCAFY